MPLIVEGRDCLRGEALRRRLGKTLVAVLVTFAFLLSTIAFGKGGSSSHGGPVSVRGYTRKDGTYVAPHMRSAPNGTAADNYSTKGNVNPYTGKEGTHSLTPGASRKSPKTTVPVLPGSIGGRGDDDDPPKKSVPSPVAKPVAPTPEKLDDEAIAANELKMAHDLKDAGRISSATHHLEIILEEYGHTRAAETARSELAVLKKQSLPPHEFRGEVKSVVDGATITVQDAKYAFFEVRLSEIDAPALDQPLGKESRQHLADKILGKRVSIKWRFQDDDGRLQGTVRLDTRDINLEMLREGFVWHFTEYSSTEDFARAAAGARNAKLGVWADLEPEEPLKQGKNSERPK